MPTTSSIKSACPMCDPAFRTPGIDSSSRLTRLVILTISGCPVPGLVNQCIRKSRSLKEGSSDCPRSGSAARPNIAVAPTAA
jgi:hypothetical protein